MMSLHEAPPPPGHGSTSSRSRRYGGKFGIRVIFGHRAISPEKWAFSDRRVMTRHACKNRLLSRRLAGPFSDTGFRTYRGMS